ncbi:hypothetical protein STEG23_001649 [Scotinomys teguina]
MSRLQCKNIGNNTKTPSKSMGSPTARHEYTNAVEAEFITKNDLQKVIEALKEEMKNSFKELEEQTNKKLEENKESQEKAIKQMKETVQDLKIEIKTIKKIQSEGRRYHYVYMNLQVKSSSRVSYPVNVLPAQNIYRKLTYVITMPKEEENEDEDEDTEKEKEEEEEEEEEKQQQHQQNLERNANNMTGICSFSVATLSPQSNWTGEFDNLMDQLRVAIVTVNSTRVNAELVEGLSS